METIYLAGFSVLVLLTIGKIFAKLYMRAGEYKLALKALVDACNERWSPAPPSDCVKALEAGEAELAKAGT